MFQVFAIYFIQTKDHYNIPNPWVPNPPRPNPNPVPTLKGAQRGPKGTGADSIILGSIRMVQNGPP